MILVLGESRIGTTLPDGRRRVVVAAVAVGGDSTTVFQNKWFFDAVAVWSEQLHLFCAVSQWGKRCAQ